MLAVTALGAWVPQAAQQEAKLEGEYGLWVEDRADSLVVHWLTADSIADAITVSTGNGQQQMHQSEAGRAHRFAMRRPRMDEVRLIFGSASARYETTLYLTPQPRRSSVPAVDSLYVLGDTHGEYDRVIQILQRAGLIDNSRRWSGGRKQLVFDGDLLDRGPDATRLLWFVYSLERAAQRAGGRVHVVLGNHELMVMLSDLRYVHPKEMKIAQQYGVSYSKLYDSRESVLGKWLARKPAVLRIGDVLFAHGGVSGRFLNYSIGAIDDSLAAYMGEELFYRWADSTAVIKIDSASYARREQFFWDPGSVFWFRGYVQTDTLGGMLEKVLEHFDSKVHVVGHTPSTEIHQKYGGKLIVSHPRQPALEMLLLVREDKEWRRLKYDLNGTLVPVPVVGN